MKQLSQLLSLYVPEWNYLPIVAIKGSAFLFTHKLVEIQCQWKMKKRKKAVEEDVWAIE